MLRVCVIDFKENWDNHFPLMEFTYNNSYHSSINLAPFKALYDRRYKPPIGLVEMGEVSIIGPKLVYEDIVNVQIIRGRVKMTESW